MEGYGGFQQKHHTITRQAPPATLFTEEGFIICKPLLFIYCFYFKTRSEGLFTLQLKTFHVKIKSI